MAIRIEGKLLAAQVKERVAAGVKELKEKGIEPCLAVIMVGENPASQVYVKGKVKDCAECGIKSLEIHLPAETTQNELLQKLAELAGDAGVHGLLVQLPLPAHIDEKTVIEAIPPQKDVDGFTAVNVGRMMIGEECFLPCTPAGCMEMIRSTGVSISGKNAVVIGRSNIVGNADILVAAVGRAGFVTGDMVKPGAVVIDVGINRNAQGKLCGDVDYDAAAEKAGYITPVPGGVGLMTRAMLMQNTLQAAQKQALAK